MSHKILKKLSEIRKASSSLKSATSLRKNAVLNVVARDLLSRSDEILKANAKDIKSLPPKTPSAFIDRLALNESRLELMAESLRKVSELPDPLDDIVRKILPNGLVLKKIRAPLGVIYMIFESRPNVATEAFGLAFKSGNALILRGGKESMATTKVLYNIIEGALEKEGFSKNTIWGISDKSRTLTHFLLKQKAFIDIVVPRGGDGLIKMVSESSAMPIIKNDRGLCHVYVHDDADLEMAVQIVDNAKTQRPGVCNSVETVLVNEKIAKAFLELLYPKLRAKDVQWYVDKKSLQLLKKKEGIKPAKPKNWDTEYLDFKMNCKIVSSLDEALEHIEKHGSRHSEAIVTSSEQTARRFQSEVDAAAVYWNASTRFTDGFEFGLGGELGISTQKLHVRGPVGLNELTSWRWEIDGTGQVKK